MPPPENKTTIEIVISHHLARLSPPLCNNVSLALALLWIRLDVLYCWNHLDVTLSFRFDFSSRDFCYAARLLLFPSAVMTNFSTFSVLGRLQRVALFLIACNVGQGTAQQCFLPNGSPATGDTPCGGSPDSTICCPSGYQCLPFTQLCYQADPANGNELAFARGSCTDQNWGAGCPNFCQTGTFFLDALQSLRGPNSC